MLDRAMTGRTISQFEILEKLGQGDFPGEGAFSMTSSISYRIEIAAGQVVRRFAHHRIA
jgi:hypothetical protein